MNKSLIEVLHDQYENEPGVRIFVEAISAYTGFPIGAIVDTFVGIKVREMQASRLSSFYNELNNGEIELNEDIIENVTFLHSYFSVLNYVARSKDDKKAARFAKIIKNLYKKEIDLDQFEDYTSIFDELSDREFAILCIKMNYENHAAPDDAILGLDKPRNPYQKTSAYWNEFVNEVLKKINIENEELEATLYRLQRTGCYKIHSGYFDMKNDGCGDTTIIFKNLFKIIKE
ncbi:MAG: hypothetical protein ACOVLG_04955 [Flavobacterium sp.]